jgi:hypothetical protein
MMMLLRGYSPNLCLDILQYGLRVLEPIPLVLGSNFPILF